MRQELKLKRYPANIKSYAIHRDIKGLWILRSTLKHDYESWRHLTGLSLKSIGSNNVGFCGVLISE